MCERVGSQVHLHQRIGRKNHDNKGSTVTIHYTLTVDDQQVESSFQKEPLTYQHGEGQLIQGLEKQLEGLGDGDVREITVDPENAYGNPVPENIVSVQKSAFGTPEEINVGAFVEGKTQDGQPFRARVAEERDEAFVLDLNHPLAGKTLEFKVEVVSVNP